MRGHSAPHCVVAVVHRAKPLQQLVCCYAGLDADELCVLNSRCPRPPGHPAAALRTGMPQEALSLVRGRGSTHPQAERAGLQTPSGEGA